MSKKGEKSLQMIFGLFILLIISLVILSLFFKFTERTSGTLGETQEEYFSKAQFESAISECENLCTKVTDVNTALEFCKQYQRIDMDGDKEPSPATKQDWGKWQFCEDRIPCFILHTCDSGKTTYDGAKCKQVLLTNRPQYYEMLEYDSTEVTGDPQAGTCQLTTEGDPENSPNWVYKYGYYEGAS